MLNIGEKICVAKCSSVKKYNLEKEAWENIENNKGKAFSIVTFNTEFGRDKFNQKKEFEYVILMNGNRRENYSKTGKDIGCVGWGTSNFLSILDEYNLKIKFENILVDNDAPLEMQSKVIANHINKLKEDPKCKKIHILGVSKCGCISVCLLKYLDKTNLEKLNIIAYQAPYLGTILASPELLYKKIDEEIGNIPEVLLNEVIPFLEGISIKETNDLSDISNIMKDRHWEVFSKSHMDYDISDISGMGVKKEHQNKYDKNFLSNLFSKETLDMLGKINFTNVTTYSTKETLTNALKTQNLNAGMLYLLDKIIFRNKLSDGMVEIKSSKYIENVCKENNIKISKLEILGGHHDICSDKMIIKEVMDNIFKIK